MSFSDLHYGWHSQTFALADVKITREVELQVQREKGLWVTRVPSMAGDLAANEAEAQKLADEDESGERRYSRLRGALTAKAVIVGIDDEMALGIPEDRRSTGIKPQARIKYIFMRIAATETEVPRADIRKGSIRYYENTEHFAAGVYANFYVSEESFDDIVRMSVDPGIEFQATLHIRGWYWLGPVGDSQLYINPKGWEKAELGAILATRSLSTPSHLELLAR